MKKSNKGGTYANPQSGKPSGGHWSGGSTEGPGRGRHYGDHGSPTVESGSKFGPPAGDRKRG